MYISHVYTECIHRVYRVKYTQSVYTYDMYTVYICHMSSVYLTHRVEYTQSVYTYDMYTQSVYTECRESSIHRVYTQCVY